MKHQIALSNVLTLSVGAIRLTARDACAMLGPVSHNHREAGYVGSI